MSKDIFYHHEGSAENGAGGDKLGKRNPCLVSDCHGHWKEIKACN